MLLKNIVFITLYSNFRLENLELIKTKLKYLLGMPIYSLTLEQKEKLLKEKGNVEKQLADLKKKTPNDLWKTDIEDFLESLDKFEKDMAKNLAEADEKVQSKAKKGKRKGGKLVLDIDPSSQGDRVNPGITDKMKKDSAPKVKREPKGSFLLI